MLDAEQLAKTAYDTYAGHREYKAVNGDLLPNWNDLQADIKSAWVAAVIAVIESI